MSAALRQAAEAIVKSLNWPADPDCLEFAATWGAEVRADLLLALRSALAASAAEEERARAAVEAVEATLAARAAYDDGAVTDMAYLPLEVAESEALARYRALKEPA